MKICEGIFTFILCNWIDCFQKKVFAWKATCACLIMERTLSFWIMLIRCHSASQFSLMYCIPLDQTPSMPIPWWTYRDRFLDLHQVIVSIELYSFQTSRIRLPLRRSLLKRKFPKSRTSRLKTFLCSFLCSLEKRLISPWYQLFSFNVLKEPNFLEGAWKVLEFCC